MTISIDLGDGHKVIHEAKPFQSGFSKNCYKGHLYLEDRKLVRVAVLIPRNPEENCDEEVKAVLKIVELSEKFPYYVEPISIQNNTVFIFKHYRFDLRMILSSPKLVESYRHLVPKFMETILLGLKHLHENRWALLDVKPENALVEDEKLVLADFGDTRMIPYKENTPFRGTLFYFPPESWERLVAKCPPLSEKLDLTKFDMWSAGMTFWEMERSFFGLKGTKEIPPFLDEVDVKDDRERFFNHLKNYMHQPGRYNILGLLDRDSQTRSSASEALMYLDEDV